MSRAAELLRLPATAMPALDELIVRYVIHLARHYSPDERAVKTYVGLFKLFEELTNGRCQSSEIDELLDYTFDLVASRVGFDAAGGSAT